ncbi:MAG: methylated-DNA--[protein]-cysteine S-methyltransferase [Planctomycetaceae bacterium]
MPRLAIFPTDLGWFGLLGDDAGDDASPAGAEVLRLVIGHVAADDVRRAIRAAEPGAEITEADWHPDLRRRLQSYARGEAADFSDCRPSYPREPAFRRRVYEAAMRIPYGAAVSYAELAAQAGSPQAARAVGNAMASNRAPILIPCHRVVGAHGKLGGFSAPQGIGLKERMLALEADANAIEESNERMIAVG